MLQKTASLRSLKLFNCCLNDYAALHIANALQRNNSLEELRLDMNDLSDAAAEMLAKCLKRNSSVTCLTLRQNGAMSDAFLRDIEQALAANRRTRAELHRRRQKQEIDAKSKREAQEAQRREAEDELKREREVLATEHKELEQKQRMQEEEEEQLQIDRERRTQRGEEAKMQRRQQMDSYIHTVIGNAYRWREQICNSPTRHRWWSGFTPRPAEDEEGEDLTVDPYLPERRLVPYWKESENPGGPPVLCYRYPHATRRPKETAATFFSAQAREPTHDR
eukprot:TRINITY_DN11227_c0_g1_i2.p1 TRINITY_DN11227_c0_g1~~TRINITY_DN11227_c0_g1_i2.p1  ORF type:complete len:278 (+),score=122.33 TRINITY_DN11227_c0_g1_i2:453-1286(+)